MCVCMITYIYGVYIYIYCICIFICIDTMIVLINDSVTPTILVFKTKTGHVECSTHDCHALGIASLHAH